MKTKHKIFSVLVTLAIVASLFVVVAPTTVSAATVTTISVTANPSTAGDTAGYIIGNVTTSEIPAAGTLTISFPPQVTLPTTISYTMISIDGVGLLPADTVTVSGQSIIINFAATHAAIVNKTISISQSAGIKNPAVAKTIASQAYPVTVTTSVDTVSVPVYLGIIPSYTVSAISGPRLNTVTVTGKGWTPNGSITIGGGLSNSSTGGIAQADGTFSVTAYPAISGNVTVVDGNGQTAATQWSPTYLAYLPLTTAPYGLAAGGANWNYNLTIPVFTISPSVTVTPGSGDAGATVRVSGTDFTSLNTLASITMGGTALFAAPGSAIPSALRSIDAFGAADDFSVQVLVPSAMPPGAKTVMATDGAGKTGSGSFTVGGPTITLTPSTGQANTTVVVNGSHFVPAETITLFWGLPGNPMPATTIVLNQGILITVDASGNWTFSFRVPSTAVNGINPVVAVSSNNTTASTAFIVGTRVLNITPSSGPKGTTAVVTGSNFTPGIANNAGLVPVIPAGSLKIGTIVLNPTAAITIDTLGNMRPTTVVIPAGIGTGSQTVSAQDSGPDAILNTNDDIVAVGAFNVTQPDITITPTTGYRGDTLAVTGTGWVPGLLGLVQIKFGTTGTVADRIVGVATPDATGNISAVFTVAPDAANTNFVSATDGSNTAANETFTLAPAAVTLSPTSGPVGTEVTVSGKGFLPLTGLGALTIGAAPGVPVLPATPVITDVLGAFSTTFTVPGLAPGAQVVTSNVGGVTVNVFFTINTSAASAKVQLASISAQLVRVWGYSNGTWQMYDPADAVGSDLASMTAGAGYFINVSAPCTIKYSTFTYNLVTGWNLIGWR